MKKTVVILATGWMLFGCGNASSNKNSGEVVSAIESGGENDASYMKENSAAMAEAEKELAEQAKSVTTLKLDKMEHDFGNIKLESENACEFKVTNTGSKPLLISDVQASCGCTTPQKPSGPIQPGKSDVIKVGFKPSSKSIDGKPISKTVTITANTDPRITVVTIKAIVE
jgi:hypothetical protein